MTRFKVRVYLEAGRAVADAVHWRREFCLLIILEGYSVNFLDTHRVIAYVDSAKLGAGMMVISTSLKLVTGIISQSASMTHSIAVTPSGRQVDGVKREMWLIGCGDVVVFTILVSLGQMVIGCSQRRVRWEL